LLLVEQAIVALAATAARQAGIAPTPTIEAS